MPDFQRKNFTMQSKGMNLASPSDVFEEGEFQLLLNVRQYQEGTLESRPGLTLIDSGWPVGGASTYYPHSGHALTDPTDPVTYPPLRYIGYNTTIRVGPVTTPGPTSLCDSGYSGFPLSMVPVRPSENSSPWLYVGDSLKMRRFSNKYLILGIPIAYPFGMPIPYVAGTGWERPAPPAIAAGPLTGTYYYRYRAIDTVVGARSNCGPPTGYPDLGRPPNPAVFTGAGLDDMTSGGIFTGATTLQYRVEIDGTAPDTFRWSEDNGASWVASGVVIDGSGQMLSNGVSVIFTSVIGHTLTDRWDFNAVAVITYGSVVLVGQTPTFTLPTMLDPNGVPYILELLRFGGNVQDWRVVGSSQADGVSTIADTMSDFDALAQDGLDETHYQPFITQDVVHNSVVDTVAAVAGTGIGDGNGSILNWVSGDKFSRYWLPGTTITFTGATTFTGTLSRYISDTSIEIVEDVLTVAGRTVVISGALKTASPLAHLFGPYQAGSGGLYLFAVGNAQAAGTLYWTNGNDPDAMDLTNSLEVTSPSEPLVNGCVYDGRVYVFSSEHVYQILPSSPGQFIAQVIPGSKGLWAPWALCVGKEGIFYRSKDGIYLTAGGTPESVSDAQLYGWFPHDDQPGVTFTVGGLTIAPPSEVSTTSYETDRISRQRLTYLDGHLYFDYAPMSGYATKAMVYDTRMMKGWLLDEYMWYGHKSRWSEDNYHRAVIGIGDSLYEFTGVQDYAVAITRTVVTSAYDCNDRQSPKRIFSSYLDANPGSAGSGLTVQPLGTYNSTNLGAATAGIIGTSRVQTIFDLNAGVGYSDRTFGMSITWAHSTALLNGWGFTYIPKPPIDAKLGIDWTDDGKPGAKYVKGMVIDAIGASAGYVDLATDTTVSKVTSAARPFTALDVGARIEIKLGGAWFPGIYTVLNVVGVVATLDHPAASAASINGIWTLGTGNRYVEVQYDGGIVGASVVISQPLETEMPYLFPVPFIASKMRLVPTDSSTWQLLKVQWLWESYPEFGAQVDDYDDAGYRDPKYVRGVSFTTDTLGSAATFQVEYDGGTAGSVLSATITTRQTVYYGFATPFLASQLRVRPLSSARVFGKPNWIFDQYPPYCQLITPWENAGTEMVKYIRGAILQADTHNIAVTLTLWADGAATGTTFAVTLNGQREVMLAFSTPVLASLIRWAPSASWAFWKTKWVYDEYPYSSTLITSWSHANYIGPKYVRGLRLTADTANVATNVPVQYDGGTVAVTLSATHNGKTTEPYAFTPFVAYMMRLAPTTNIRIFEDEIEWIFDPYPDLAAIYTSILNAKAPGAKLIQGIRLTADTNNVATQFQILADGVLATTLPATAFAGKLTKPFSWITPFIAHNLQIIPLTSARIWVDETEFVWEPAPELTENWAGPFMTHGFPGWFSLVDGYIAHFSTADLTFTITRDDATSYSFTIPHGTGTYKRTYLRLRPIKARSIQCSITSPAKFRLYLQDSLLHAKKWGAGPDDHFSPIRPFGDLSVTDGARI